ncbi:sensor histidine kinase [Saccharibacillus kuerlensis]|uniref:histidine kinase n=1 Tax=Saccharibacillus kuerlensis TaxID=459527 RepID=A0ABQ2L5P4_9BACL|nr:HAMP domain-containing sensor histidine kinase [Saccharibacillus kuerlensis]GGO02202.1 two-component sensor histidine kinase [Saccharibacillus kuerlensis]
MKRGIAFKLFLITSAVMLGMLFLLLLAQSLFFQSFYQDEKIREIERDLKQTADQYAEAAGSPAASARLLGEFTNKNRAAFAVLNKDFARRSLDPYFITLRTPGGKEVTLLPSSAGTMADEMPDGLQSGDALTVDGIYMDQNDTIMQPTTLQPDTPSPEQGLSRVDGTVADLLLPSNQTLDPFYTNALIDEALVDLRQRQEQYAPQLNSGKTVRSEWTDKWSGLTYAVIAVPIGNDREGGGGYALALASLQPVGEAVDMLRRYVIYLAPAAAIVLLILSLLYSRLLSRPLVRLSRTSARMASMDFAPDEGRTIRSSDELGELSQNLDTLGHNLDAALRNLSQANEELNREVEAKNRSEELRKELIANISHELKTPLGIVKGFAEGLQDDVAADKRERYLQLIVGETDRMNALILDMLQLSRFEAKAIKLKPEKMQLSQQIRTLLDALSAQIEGKGLRATLVEEKQTPYVIADPRRIEQVLLNLLSNAVRHAREGGEIRIEIKSGANGTVSVRIENDGEPIPERELELIWEQFYRAERSRDRKSGGTGLGLAIVRHILELHGSPYGAENTERGVAFHFTLEEAASEEEERNKDE